MVTRIGVSMNYRADDDGFECAYLDHFYFEFLAAAGAVPIPIVPVEDARLLNLILESLDGVLFSGGGDLHPSLWNEQAHGKITLVHPRRQRLEFMLYEKAREKKLPILGICLGMQLINIAHRGSLYQHLPDIDRTIEHGGDGEESEHEIILNKKSMLKNWLGRDRVTVNSFHHQGINRLGQGLIAAAAAEDGVIEAVEDPQYPFLIAVQWHPERDLDREINNVLVGKFLEAARDNGN